MTFNSLKPLPKKITPDNISEAIVELRYSSTYQHELLIGIFFNLLDTTYTYTNRPIQQPLPPITSPGNLMGQTLNIQVGAQYLFYNKKIQIVCNANSFIFSSLSSYIGWSQLRLEIEAFLRFVAVQNYISGFTRIGVRFISHYEHDLLDIINFNFSFGLPETKSKSFVFRSEFDYDTFAVILNLSSNTFIKIIDDKSKGIQTAKPISIVDIDTVYDRINISILEDLLPAIDQVHIKQKQVFFNLIKEDYLKTLNPQY